MSWNVKMASRFKRILISVNTKELYADILIFLVVLSLTILLENVIAYWSTRFFYQNIWIHFDADHGLTKIGVMSSIVVSILLCLFHWRKNGRYPSGWVASTINLIGWLCIYFWFRGKPEFMPIYCQVNSISIPYFSPFIIVFLYTLFLMFLEYRIRKTREESNNSIYVMDNVNLEDDFDLTDEFGRTGKANFIARQILQLEQNHAFAFGIVGRWGSGKTHFIKQILSSIRRRSEGEFTILHFVPWKVGKANLEISFLELVEEHTDGELAAKIRRYAQQFHQKNRKLTELNPLAFFASEKKVSRESVNSSIIKSKKKLLIVIDDIDRLDKEEVVEVFRIIRNTANFANTIYLVAYDRAYVENAIEQINSVNPSEYLKKIVQLQFYLPTPDRQALLSQFRLLCLESIKKFYGTRDIPTFNIIADKLEAMFRGISTSSSVKVLVQMMGGEPDGENATAVEKDHFSNFVTNARDVISLTNSFVQNMLEDGKYEIVNLNQLYLIELLKLKTPEVYDNLRTKKYFDNSPPHVYIFREEQFDQFLQHSPLPWEFRVPVKLLLSELFRPFSMGEASDNGVRNPDFFQWYFDSFTTLVSPDEKRNIFSVSDTDLYDVLFVLQRHKGVGLFDLASTTQEFETEQDAYRFEIVKLYVSLLNSNYLTSGHFFLTLGNVKLDESNRNKLRNQIVEILRTQYKLYPQSCTRIIGQLINYYFDNGNNNNFSPDIKALQSLILEILEQQYFGGANYLTLLDVFNVCIERVDGNDRTYSTKACDLMKSYVTEHPAEFLKNIIVPVRAGDKDSPFVVQYHAIKIFAGIEQLYAFICSLPLNSLILETRHFVEEFAVNRVSELHWQLGAITYYSNQFTKVKPMAVEGPYQASISFTHPSASEIAERHKWMAKYLNNFIAHMQLIPKEEAIAGGKYSFLKSFNLFEPDLIKAAVLRIWVDDAVTVSINGKQIGRGEFTTSKELQMSVPKEFLLRGENKIEFVVRNYSLQELGWKDADGHSNPYALVYELELKL